MRPIAFTLCANLASALPLAAQFGELPAAPLMTVRYGGVRAEIVISFLIPPSALNGRLPPGLRPQLRGVPEDSSHRVPLNLSVVAADTIEVGGTRLASSSHGWAVDASLWTAVDSATVPRDARAHGDRSALALVAWRSDPGIVKKLRAAGVPAEKGTVAVDSFAGGWSFELVLDSARLAVRCRLMGKPQALSYPLPAFATVWQAGGLPIAFTVYTYFGHVGQSCNPQISMDGVYALFLPLKESARWPSAVRGQVLTGWRARAGIYR